MQRRLLLQQLTAASGLLAAPQLLIRPALAERGAAYQRIWDADQSNRGLPALTGRERGDKGRGYVRIDTADPIDRSDRVLAEVVIPADKRASYDLCKPLFDNFRLDQTKPEDTSPAEAREILALLAAVTDSAPMEEARRLVGELRGRDYSKGSWQDLIFTLWFRQFDDGRNRDLSGFEHVAVGEQRAGSVSGYHFWYKYYLDDWGLLGNGDVIDVDGLRFDRRLLGVHDEVPEVLTLAFRWRAPEAGTSAQRPIYKPVGSFWVGCSIEGLMALGTLRFFERGPVTATINRGRYQLDLYRSPDNQSLRTFFPELIGLA